MTVDYHERRETYLDDQQDWMLSAVLLHCGVTVAGFTLLFLLLSEVETLPIPVIGLIFLTPPIYLFAMVQPSRLVRRYEATHPYSNYFTGAP